MVRDKQVILLRKSREAGMTVETAAARAGMSERTGRRWLRQGRLPSQGREPHTWRTRPDPFAEVWPQVEAQLQLSPGLEAKTLFQELQRQYPGRFAAGQLRTLQRRVRQWRALEGPPKEVFFPQEHRPGERCCSDFCHLAKLAVTVAGQSFAPLLYHFVLPYSNWETGSLCWSESFESLSGGLQAALWELGGVPRRHRTDRLSAAVRPPQSPEKFTVAYEALLRHYGLVGERINAGQAHENGDVEQRHFRLRNTLEQALLLRGSRDFASVEEFEAFLAGVWARENAGRQARLAEELPLLQSLPARCLEASKYFRCKVGPSSTIRVQHNVYSVPSRLIGLYVEVRQYAQRLEIWLGQARVETLPRLGGESRHRINYRHVIDWLVRKPGAFADYRYREDLFPTSRFRMAYDALVAACPAQAVREYLQILYLAARESEAGVEEALHVLLAQEEPPRAAAVAALVKAGQALPLPQQVEIPPPDLAAYDELLAAEVAA
jgi:hypothetical protein